MSVRLTKQLRERLAKAVDPMDFLERVAKGQPVRLVHPNGRDAGTLVPSMAQVYEVNMWIAERLVPKVKEVTLEHDVSDALADRVRAARARALENSPNIGATSLPGGGGPAKPAPSSLSLVPRSKNPSPENTSGENFDQAPAVIDAEVVEVPSENIPAPKIPLRKNANSRLAELHKVNQAARKFDPAVIPDGFGRVPPPGVLALAAGEPKRVQTQSPMPPPTQSPMPPPTQSPPPPNAVQTVVVENPEDEDLTSDPGDTTSMQLLEASILEGL